MVVAGVVGVTGEVLAACSNFEPDHQVYEIIRLMKLKLILAARAFLWVLALVVTQGCATPQPGAAGRSWSQIAAEEEQEQQLLGAPPNDWSVP